MLCPVSSLYHILSRLHKSNTSLSKERLVCHYLSCAFFFHLFGCEVQASSYKTVDNILSFECKFPLFQFKLKIYVEIHLLPQNGSAGGKLYPKVDDHNNQSLPLQICYSCLFTQDFDYQCGSLNMVFTPLQEKQDS